MAVVGALVLFVVGATVGTVHLRGSSPEDQQMVRDYRLCLACYHTLEASEQACSTELERVHVCVASKLEAAACGFQIVCCFVCACEIFVYLVCY